MSVTCEHWMHLYPGCLVEEARPRVPHMVPREVMWDGEARVVWFPGRTQMVGSRCRAVMVDVAGPMRLVLPGGGS